MVGPPNQQKITDFSEYERSTKTCVHALIDPETNSEGHQNYSQLFQIRVGRLTYMISQVIHAVYLFV